MSHASPPGADAPAWTPSQVEVDRRRFRQRRTARSAGLSALSTLAVLGVLTALLVGSPGWPRVRETYFDPAKAVESLPAVAEGIWLNVRIMIVCAVLIAVLGLVIAIMLAWTSAPVAVRRIPGPLVAIAAATAVAVILRLDVDRITLDGNFFDAIALPEMPTGNWGAVALGALGAWIGARREGVPFAVLADAIAPGLPLAQAIGRFGNYFNQELYGSPTTLPWGLRIDEAHLPAGSTYPPGTLFHPTFLYEALWNLAGAVLLVWIGRRMVARSGATGGRLLWIYLMVYTAGRVWIEMLRIDEAETVLGLRLNVWTSIIIFLVGAIGLALASRRPLSDAIDRPGRGTRKGRSEDEDDSAENGSAEDDSPEGSSPAESSAAAAQDQTDV